MSDRLSVHVDFQMQIGRVRAEVGASKVNSDVMSAAIAQLQLQLEVL